MVMSLQNGECGVPRAQEFYRALTGYDAILARI